MLTVSDEQLAYKHRELLYRVRPWTLLTLTTVQKLTTFFKNYIFEKRRQFLTQLPKMFCNRIGRLKSTRILIYQIGCTFG